MRREICECDRCHKDITKEPKYKVHVPGIFSSKDLDWEVCVRCCSEIRAFMFNKSTELICEVENDKKTEEET